MNRLI
jgi:hypothetical protein